MIRPGIILRLKQSVAVAGFRVATAGTVFLVVEYIPEKMPEGAISRMTPIDQYMLLHQNGTINMHAATRDGMGRLFDEVVF